jgi:hypothetical protein
VTAFPVPGEHRFRLSLILPEGRKEKRAEISLDELEATARSMLPVAFRITKAIVLSRHRLHHRVATRRSRRTRRLPAWRPSPGESR